MRVEMVHVVLIPSVVPEKGVGKQPFANQEAFFTELVVDRQAELMREMKVQVMALYLATVGFQQGREGPQLDGWVDMEPEGHVDQCYFQRHAGIVSITMWRSTIKNGSGSPTVSQTRLVFTDKSRILSIGIVARSASRALGIKQGGFFGHRE